MTPYELGEYYANLLILRYKGKPKAYAEIQALSNTLNMLQTTVQKITLSDIPDSGSIVFGYGSLDTAAIAFDASEADIQTAFRALAGLSAVTISGRLATGSFTLTFLGVDPAVAPIIVVSSTLEAFSGDPVTAAIAEIDVTLPLAVQDGYNLTGERLAAGLQLDVIAKYVGVARTGVGPKGQFTLSDTDLLQLIRIAIDRNKLTSRFGDIVDFLNKWFPSLVLVTDNFDMTITFDVSVTLEQTGLWQLFIAFDLLPRPIGVGTIISIAPPVTDGFFGFRTYEASNPAVLPMNDYVSPSTNGKLFTYEDA